MSDHSDIHRLSRETVDGSVYIDRKRVVRFVALPCGKNAFIYTDDEGAYVASQMRGRLEIVEIPECE